MYVHCFSKKTSSPVALLEHGSFIVDGMVVDIFLTIDLAHLKKKGRGLLSSEWGIGE